MAKASSDQWHGMGLVPEGKDWPNITLADPRLKQKVYALLKGAIDIVCHSPRSCSCACIINTLAESLLIRRSASSLCSVSNILEEHAFTKHMATHDTGVITGSALWFTTFSYTDASLPWLDAYLTLFV